MEGEPGRGLSSVYKRRVEQYGGHSPSTEAPPVSGFFAPLSPSPVSPLNLHQPPSPVSPLTIHQPPTPVSPLSIHHPSSPVSPLSIHHPSSPASPLSIHQPSSPASPVHFQHVNHHEQGPNQQEFPFRGFAPQSFSPTPKEDPYPGRTEVVQDKVNHGFFPNQIFVQFPNSPLLSHPAPEKERRNTGQRELNYPNFEREERVPPGSYLGLGNYRQPVQPLSHPTDNRYNKLVGDRKEEGREGPARPSLQGRRRPEQGAPHRALFPGNKQQGNFRPAPPPFQQAPRRNFRPQGEEIEIVMLKDETVVHSDPRPRSSPRTTTQQAQASLRIPASS